MAIVTLSHTPAKIVQYLLIQLGLGTVPPLPSNPPPTKVVNNWPVYSHIKIVSSNKNVSYPTNAIIVYGPAGMLDGKVMRTGVETEHYGIMIHTRDPDPEVSFQKGLVIKDTILQSVYLTNVVVPAEQTADNTNNPSAAYTVQSFHQTSPVMPLGSEAQERWFTSSSNFTVTLWEVD